jgi:hypothetical protein
MKIRRLAQNLKGNKKLKYKMLQKFGSSPNRGRVFGSSILIHALFAVAKNSLCRKFQLNKEENGDATWRPSFKSQPIS